MELNERGAQNVREGLQQLTKAIVAGMIGGALALLLFYGACNWAFPQAPTPTNTNRSHV